MHLQLKRGVVGAILAIMLGFIAQPSRAFVIADSAGTSTSTTAGFYGESVTLPAGGPFTGITFSFFDGATPIAPGTLYVFASPFSGAPDALGTAGAVGRSVSNINGVYMFAPGLALNGGQQYFLYADTPVAAGGITLSANDTYAGGDLLFAPADGHGFAALRAADVNFLLDPQNPPFDPLQAAPEPRSIALLAGAVLGLAVALGRTRRRMAA